MKYLFIYIANFLASQMWNLAVCLPLMVGDLVPHTDEEWECFLLLLDVLQICVSPGVSVDLVEYLTVLIEMYLSAFRKCYPDKNIIPKQHYMTHFPSQILNSYLAATFTNKESHKECCLGSSL